MRLSSLLNVSKLLYHTVDFHWWIPIRTVAYGLILDMSVIDASWHELPNYWFQEVPFPEWRLNQMWMMNDAGVRFIDTTTIGCYWNWLNYDLLLVELLEWWDINSAGVSFVISCLQIWTFHGINWFVKISNGFQRLLELLHTGK